MNLYLLRHGEAEASAHTDAARQLTAKGRQDVENVAKQFALRQLPLDHCFVSPYVRAVQTAEIFFGQLGESITSSTTELLVPEVHCPQTKRRHLQPRPAQTPEIHGLSSLLGVHPKVIMQRVV